MKRVQRPSARRVAIITGGASGLGAAITRRLLADGLSVAVLSRDPGRLRVNDREILRLRVDITQAGKVMEAVAAVEERFGRIDVLINNAGTPGPIKPIQEIALEDWNDTLNVNLTGAFLCCKFVVPVMIKSGRNCRIVNVSSMVGKKAAAFRTAYSSSKMGLIGFTRALSRELGKFGITVNAISPGPIEGERIQGLMQKVAAAGFSSPDEVKKRLLDASAIHRFATPDEVAGLVSFLVSPGSGAITGQDLYFDAT